MERDGKCTWSAVNGTTTTTSALSHTHTPRDTEMHSAKSHRVQRVHFDIISFYYYSYFLFLLGWVQRAWMRRMHIYFVHFAWFTELSQSVCSDIASGRIKRAKKTKMNKIWNGNAEEAYGTGVRAGIVAHMAHMFTKRTRNYLNIWYPIPICERKTDKIVHMHCLAAYELARRSGQPLTRKPRHTHTHGERELASTNNRPNEAQERRKEHKRLVRIQHWAFLSLVYPFG